MEAARLYVLGEALLQMHLRGHLPSLCQGAMVEGPRMRLMLRKPGAFGRWRQTLQPKELPLLPLELWTEDWQPSQSLTLRWGLPLLLVWAASLVDWVAVIKDECNRA